MSRTARGADYVLQMNQYREAEEIASEATVAIREAREITDEESAAAASEALVNASQAVKDIDKQRLSATEPYRNSTKTIDTQFNELKSPVVGAVESLRERITVYHQERQRIADEARKKAEEEERARAAEQKKAEEKAAREAEEARKAGEPEPPPPPPAPEPPPPPAPAPPPRRVRHTASGSVSMRQVRKHEVINEDELERQYLVPSAQLIKRAVDDGVKDIPGVRIWTEEVPVSRRAR